jgi:hypothetical protein
LDHSVHIFRLLQGFDESRNMSTVQAGQENSGRGDQGRIWIYSCCAGSTPPPPQRLPPSANWCTQKQGVEHRSMSVGLLSNKPWGHRDASGLENYQKTAGRQLTTAARWQPARMKSTH